MKTSNKIMLLFSALSVGILSALSTFTATALDVVPPEAVYYNEHYYMIYDDLKDFENPSWELAQRLCESRGGHLAIIDDNKEDEKLYDMFTDSGYENIFFGLYLDGEEWKWTNGRTAEYLNWSKNQPSGNGSYGIYSRTHKKGKWFDGDYDRHTTAYICEWDSGIPYNSTLRYTENLDPILPYSLLSFGNSKYKIYDYPLTFEQASDFCNLMGGHLAFIDSQEKQDFIFSELEKSGKKNMYWIGAFEQFRQWCWENNDKSADMVYTNWASTEPQNPDGYSVHAVMNLKSPNFEVGSWVAESNIGAEYREEEYYTNYGFICEWEYACISEKGKFLFHKPENWKTLKVPTCTEGGAKNYKCSRCNETINTKPVPALGHDNERLRLFDIFDFNPIPGIEKYDCRRCREINYRFNAKGFLFDISIITVIVVMIVAFISAKKEYEHR